MCAVFSSRSRFASIGTEAPLPRGDGQTILLVEDSQSVRSVFERLLRGLGYVVVSADGHAGLACDDYRPYLEAKFHPAFDAYVAERNAHREESLKMNFEYIMGWETAT